MGGALFLGFNIMTGKQVAFRDPEGQEGLAIHGSVTNAINIGRTIREAHNQGRDPMTTLNAFFKETESEYKEAKDVMTGSASVLSSGKVVDIESREEGGFAFGFVTIEYPGKGQLIVGVQNENMVAFKVKSDGGYEVLEVTPNLITIVDTDSFEPITCGTWKYGQKVSVVSLQSPKLMNTEKARKVVGPEGKEINKLIAGIFGV